MSKCRYDETFAGEDVNSIHSPVLKFSLLWLKSSVLLSVLTANSASVDSASIKRTSGPLAPLYRRCRSEHLQQLSSDPVIENARRVSFDIKFTRQGFEKASKLSSLAERFNMRSQSRAW